jgi:hypothetical protein
MAALAKNADKRLKSTLKFLWHKFYDNTGGIFNPELKGRKMVWSEANARIR